MVAKSQPWKVAGLYLIDDRRMIWHVDVDKDILRGSGRALPNEIALRLGMHPPANLTLQCVAGDVMVAWQETSNIGAIHGSLRALAEHLGAVDRDRLRLIFDADERTLVGELVPGLVAGVHGTEALIHLTGLPESRVRTPDAPWSTIGVGGPDVVAALEQRGGAEASAHAPSYVSLEVGRRSPVAVGRSRRHFRARVSVVPSIFLPWRLNPGPRTSSRPPQKHRTWHAGS